jgi:hypothetical protein
MKKNRRLEKSHFHDSLANSNDFDRFTKSEEASPLQDKASLTSSIQLLLYLIPVVGFFPSLWTLYTRQGNREQLTASRLSITLALTWIVGYFFLGTGAETSEFFTLRLLILNGFLTSGYFLASIWLILNALRGRNQRIPGFSRFAERFLGKYL